MSTAVDLSLVIVSWNTCELLVRCLDTVRAEMEREQALTTETFVVDNASGDGSVDAVRRAYPWVRLVANEQNAGFAVANNQGIRRSAGRYVLLLNSDTELHPGALGTLVEFMDGHPRAGAAGARLVNTDGSLQAGCHPLLTPGREFWRLLFLDRFWRRATYPLQQWDATTPRAVEVIKGACLLLRREALHQVGLLDERYYMYTEEMDLCYRLALGGWQLWYFPAAVVTHHGGASSAQAPVEMYLELYRSKVQFHRKFGGAGQARLFKSLVAMAYVPRLLVQPSRQAYRRLLSELPGM